MIIQHEKTELQLFVTQTIFLPFQSETDIAGNAVSQKQITSHTTQLFKEEKK